MPRAEPFPRSFPNPSEERSPIPLDRNPRPSVLNRRWLGPRETTRIGASKLNVEQMKRAQSIGPITSSSATGVYRGGKEGLRGMEVTFLE